MSLFHSLLSASGNLFSGLFIKASFPVLTKEASWNSIRETSHFEIDDDTWGMTFQINLLDGGDNVRYATSPKSDPHNYTKFISTVIIDPSWCSAPEGLRITKSGNDWCGLYTDRTLRQMGVATCSGTFGEFTDSGGAVIDFTALTDKGYRYLRHVSAPVFWNDRWWATIEGRNYNGDSPEGNRGNRKIWLIYSQDSFPNLLNWTIVETPIFDPLRYSGKFVGGAEPWTPYPVVINNRFYVMWWGVNMRGDNDMDKALSSFHLMYSEAALLDTWTIVSENRPFLHTQTVCGNGDANQFESPDLWYENGNLHVYYNGNDDNSEIGLNYETGYYTFQRGGAFLDVLPGNLIEDAFADSSIDPAKWTYSPQGGLSITETTLWTIAGNGAQNQSLVEILSSVDGYTRASKVALVLSFDMSRASVAGGNCRIGLFNSDNTKYIAIDSKGSSNGQVTKLVNVGPYSSSVAVTGTKFKIVVSGCYASFQQYTNGQWVDLDPTSTTRWRLISSWGLSDTFKIKILASNVSGTAFSMTLDDISLREIDSPYYAPFVISDKKASIVSASLANYSALTAQEISALTTFINSCVDNGNWWDLLAMHIFKLNATDALKDLKSGTVATNSGATHGANGFSFDGTNDFIDSNINLRTLVGSASRRSVLSCYIHTAGAQAANRTPMSAYDGSNISRIFYSTVLGSAGFSMSSLANSAISGLLLDDSVYAAQRNYSESKASVMYRNGVPINTTSGAVHSAQPNADLMYGQLAGIGNYFSGTLGMGAVFSRIHDHEAWNTDVRQLITDLT